MHTRPEPSRNLVLTWLALAATIAYIQRMAIGVAAPEIRQSLALSAPAMGWVMSGYYWSYAFGQLPMSWVGHRLGSRWMLAGSVGGASLLTAAVALTATAVEFAVLWLLAGVAIAGTFPSCVRTIRSWFPSYARAFPSGTLGSAMSVGGAISTTLTGWLLVHLALSHLPPWRMVFVLYSLPGLAWAVGFALWFRKPQPSRPLADADAVSTGSLQVTAPLDYAGWWLDYRTWLICTQQFFRAAGYVFYATWFPSYLNEVHQVSLESAGMLTSLPLLGVVLGGAMGGWLSDWLEWRTGSKRISRQCVGVTVHATCGLLVLAAQRAVDPLSAVGLIALGSWIYALGRSGSYAVTMDMGGRRAPTLFALMNTTGNIGAALSPVVVGQLIPLVG